MTTDPVLATHIVYVAGDMTGYMMFSAIKQMFSAIKQPRRCPDRYTRKHFGRGCCFLWFRRSRKPTKRSDDDNREIL